MSISGVELERQLKAVTKTGKYIVGRKEVLHGLKGTKLLVWSASAGVPPQLLQESKTLSIPSLRFEGNPIELGKACGIPYKVSVFAVKSAGEAVISQFESSMDYGVVQENQATRSRGKDGEESENSAKPRKRVKKEVAAEGGEKETKTDNKTRKRSEVKKTKKGDDKEKAEGAKDSRKKRTPTKSKVEKKMKGTGKKSEASREEAEDGGAKEDAASAEESED